MYDTEKEIAALVTGTCQKVATKSFVKTPSDMKIHVRFNNRFYMAAGKCHSKRECDPKHKFRYLGTHILEFSRIVWNVASDVEKRETIIHETCHALSLTYFGHKAWGHDRWWRVVMSWAECPPTITSNISMHLIKAEVVKRKLTRKNKP